jgi:hypothetical protein
LFTSAIIFENCILDNFFSQEQLYIYIRVWQKMLGYILCNFFAKSSGHPNWALRKTKTSPAKLPTKKPLKDAGRFETLTIFLKKPKILIFQLPTKICQSFSDAWTSLRQAQNP